VAADANGSQFVELRSNVGTGSGGSGGGVVVVESADVLLTTVPSGSAASNQDEFNVAEYSHSRIYNGQFSFSGITNFKIKYQRPLTITSVQKAAAITDLRAGKNGVTPTTMTFPYSIAVGDIIEYAATYDQYTDSYFTLIGSYTD